MNRVNHVILYIFLSILSLVSLTSCATSDIKQSDAQATESTNDRNWKYESAIPSKTLVYKTIGNDELVLDIFYPANHKKSDNTPAIVFFHGGNWQSGVPMQFYRQSDYLASRGMVAISASYRVEKRHGTTPVESVMDAKSAIRHLRSNAAVLGINPDMIAAGGGSAGGHIAAASATVSGFNDPNDDLSVSAVPNALVLFNPVYDNGPEGYGHERVKQHWQAISPLHNIHANMPPTMVFFGEEDKLVPVATAKLFQAKMQDLGIRSELSLFAKQGHAFFNDARFNETVFQMDEFLTSLGYLSGKPEISATAVKPNFVFIAIDDMNDWVGYMGGHPQAITPNLDALADDGVAFMNAHSVAPGCSPSRNALLYGIEPYNSGLYAFYDHDIHKQLHEEYVSLPRFLKENGYKTYGAGKIHHGPKDDEREWHGYFEKESMKKTFAEDKGFKFNNKVSFRATTNPLEEHPDYLRASYGIDIINQKHDQPYFVAIGLVKPHLPFDCPEQFYDALPEKIEPPAILANDLDDIGAEGNSMRRAGDDKKFKQNKVWGKVRKAYLACNSWVDYNVGRIIEAVEQSPEADNTVIILWSDHGFHMGEKQSFRKFTLWEESSRVPFIIHDRRMKNTTSGRKVTQAVTLINVYKTMAEMAGLDTPEYVDGFSLTPLLKNQNRKVRQPAIQSWGRGNYSVRTEKWRLIKYFDGTLELYDHQNDPQEWHNLALKEAYQDKIAELTAMLPRNEAPTVEEYINRWSIYGADKERLKSKLKEDSSDNKKSKKQKKKEKKKNKN